MEFDPKLTEDEMDSMYDELERIKEGRHPASAGIGIFCPVISVLAIIAVIMILTFAWRSCIP